MKVRINDNTNLGSNGFPFKGKIVEVEESAEDTELWWMIDHQSHVLKTYCTLI